MRRSNIPFKKWLNYCEEDRTTDSMLSTHFTCTLYFLINQDNEIFGSIVLIHEVFSGDTYMRVSFFGIATMAMYNNAVYCFIKMYSKMYQTCSYYTS